MIVILDNGHGSNTLGKCSPDKKLLEYKYTREIVKRIAQQLKIHNIDSYILTPEETDISLKERVNRANKVYKDNNKEAILISVHCNAAGSDNKWHSARGWSVYISPNASNNSKELATNLAKAAENTNLKIRKETSDKYYWTQNLYICKYSNCPAVLTENLFQDNKQDVEFLLSDEGKDSIVKLHVNGILQYLKQK